MPDAASLNTAFEPLLVGLRFVLGVITAYTALDQFSRLRSVGGRGFLRSFVVASLVLGLTIWVGHFIGLQALSVYDEPGIAFYTNTYAGLPALYSLAAAMVTAFGALCLTKVKVGRARWLLGGIWLGVGLGITRDLDTFVLFVPTVAHLDAVVRISWFAVTLVGSILAFWLASRDEPEPAPVPARSLWPAALLLGVAITAAQFASLSAAVITLPAEGRAASEGTLSITDLWAVSIVILGLIGMYFYRVAMARSQQALADLRAEANYELEIAQLKRDLLGTASHELRTPLAVIVGNAELLEDGVGGELSPEQHQVLSALQAGAARLGHLVDNMLDFVALEAGTFASEKAEDDLRAVVDEVCDECRPRAEEAGMTLSVTLPPEPVRVCMDRRRIAQVLRGLVDNAIKFNHPSGQVDVVLEAHVDAVRLTVRDTGIGIAEADLPHIFDVFSQVDHGSTRVHSGAGLGLAVARGLVQNHGGLIGVESTLGVGSAFWFTLPTQCGQSFDTGMTDQAFTPQPH